MRDNVWYRPDELYPVTKVTEFFSEIDFDALLLTPSPTSSACTTFTVRLPRALSLAMRDTSALRSAFGAVASRSWTRTWMHFMAGPKHIILYLCFYFFLFRFWFRF
jgi:hypothetical protein